MRLTKTMPLATAVSATALMILPAVAAAEPPADPPDMVIHTDAPELAIGTAGAHTTVTFTPGIPLGGETFCVGPLVTEGSTADIDDVLDPTGTGTVDSPNEFTVDQLLELYEDPIGIDAAIAELLAAVVADSPGEVPPQVLETLRKNFKASYLAAPAVGKDLNTDPDGEVLLDVDVHDIFARGGMDFGPTSNTFTYALDPSVQYVAVGSCNVDGELIAYVKDIGAGTGDTQDTVRPGATLNVTFVDLPAGTKAIITRASDETEIGTYDVNADGTVTFTHTLPTDFAAGEHHFYAYDEHGNRLASIPFTVSADGAETTDLTGTGQGGQPTEPGPGSGSAEFFKGLDLFGSLGG